MTVRRARVRVLFRLTRAAQPCQNRGELLEYGKMMESVENTLSAGQWGCINTVGFLGAK